jgi:hypothetical protein
MLQPDHPLTEKRRSLAPALLLVVLCLAMLSSCRSDGGAAVMGTGTWRGIPELQRLPNPIAVWSGEEMLAWNGRGGRYDPGRDTWTPMAAGGGYRAFAAVAWSGQALVLWGGRLDNGRADGTGVSYDPRADSWAALPLAGAPSAREPGCSVWTGTQLIVWGGAAAPTEFGKPPSYFADGAALDVAAGRWRPLSNYGALGARAGCAAAWTGALMLVWGGTMFDGSSSRVFGDGAAYDPGADRWRPLSMVGAPAGRRNMTGVWTGEEFVIWGGLGCGGADGPCGDGAAYDPARDLWRRVSARGAPSARFNHTALWTGGEMIVWGGGEGLRDGARYDPRADAWTPVSITDAPAGRTQHVAVWTGAEMLVWGGSDGHQLFRADGGRYTP